MFLGDFHLHSTFSDGKLSIPELVDLYGSRGFGAIAVTDHLCEDESFIGKAARLLKRTLTPAIFPIYRNILESEAERAWDLYRMVLIPGFELTQNTVKNSRSAHILGLGITDYIHAHSDAKILTREIRDQGALAIAAHPVNTGIREKQTYHLWSRREELRHDFDAWEVASGPHLFQEVLSSDLPRIASSDLHHPRQIRSWKTKFSCERSREAIFDAIRKQKIEFHFYEESYRHETHRPPVRNVLAGADSNSSNSFIPR